MTDRTQAWIDVLRDKADHEFKSHAINKWANDPKIPDAEFRRMVQYILKDK